VPRCTQLQGEWITYTEVSTCRRFSAENFNVIVIVDQELLAWLQQPKLLQSPLERKGKFKLKCQEMTGECLAVAGRKRQAVQTAVLEQP